MVCKDIWLMALQQIKRGKRRDPVIRVPCERADLVLDIRWGLCKTSYGMI